MVFVAPEFLRVGATVVAALIKAHHISARTERLFAGAVENDQFDSPITAPIFQGLRDNADLAIGQRVERLRPVQGDTASAPFGAHDDFAVGMGLSHVTQPACACLRRFLTAALVYSLNACLWACASSAMLLKRKSICGCRPGSIAAP